MGALLALALSHFILEGSLGTCGALGSPLGSKETGGALQAPGNVRGKDGIQNLERNKKSLLAIMVHSYVVSSSVRVKRLNYAK